jgi:hypothetical protein
MSLADFNPLSYFKELSIFPRTVFLIGFVFFGIALTHGVSTDNELLLLSFALISFALACHYFSRSLWCESSPPYREHINWKRTTAGVLMLIVTVIFLSYLDQLHRHHAFLEDIARHHLPVFPETK